MKLKKHYLDLISKVADCSSDLVKGDFTPEDFNEWLIAVRTFNCAFSGLSLDDVVENYDRV